MKYSVSYSGNNFISTIVSIIVYPIFIAISIYLLATNKTEQSILLILGIIFFGIFTLLLAYSIYRSIRPRIKFDSGVITYYPLWHKKRIVELKNLDERREEVIDYNKSNELKTYFELLIYKNATLVFNVVTYYSNGEEKLKFDLNMKNATDFDKYLLEHLG